MRKLAFCIVFLLQFVYIYSQDLDYYYLEIKEGYELGEIQKTVNTDQTLTLSMQNTDLASALNAKPIYTFEKAFDGFQNPKLMRTFILGVSNDINIDNILYREEIESYEILDDNYILTGNTNDYFFILPNDYDDIITGGRNTAMDLIRAPQAWTITRGDGAKVGIVDTKVDINHEDLIGQNIVEIQTSVSTTPHGTSTAGMVAAKTNNNKGISSIAHEASLFVTRMHGFSRLIELVNNVPDVKVINVSWGSCSYSASHELVYQELLENGILVVAAAGNGPASPSACGSDGYGYFYPSAYPSTLSVTTVGERVSPTYFHNILSPNGTVWWHRSWKDVHEFRPDTPNTASHNHNDKVDVTSPGQLLLGLTDDYEQFPLGYHLKIATSPSAPIVSGVAALVFAANPNLTATQVKDIIKNTADDIYHIPYNQPYIGQLGTGRVNAYRAVLTAKCMDDPNYIGELDLMVRNSMVDYGYEPDNNTQQVFWNSQDIWVRPNSGESYIDVHENPEYDPINPNYINVRVTNRSCVTSSGNEELKLNWAKADTGLSWPAPWDGSVTVGNNIPLGGEVGTLNIPPLEPGQEVVIEFEWMVPNPEDYIDLNPNPWHFCFLAQIITPMTLWLLPPALVGM